LFVKEKFVKQHAFHLILIANCTLSSYIKQKYIKKRKLILKAKSHASLFVEECWTPYLTRVIQCKKSAQTKVNI